MSAATVIADNIRAQGRFFQSVIDVAAYLDTIGSIEQATTEATQARDAALADRDKALSDLAMAQQSVLTAQASADACTAKVADALTQAANTADAMRAQASTDAAQIVAVAQAQAEATTAATASAQDTLASVQGQIVTARGELSDLTAKVAAVKQDLAAFIK